MNFCGQQHNKNRKRDLLHVSPEKNICTCSQKTGLFCPAADGSRTRGHALSLSVTHKRLGSRSWGQSLAYFFHLAMLFFFCCLLDRCTASGSPVSIWEEEEVEVEEEKPPPKPFSIQSSTGSTSKTPGIFLGSQLVKPPEITHGSWITPSSGDVTLIFRQHTHTTTHTRAAGDKKVQK